MPGSIPVSMPGSKLASRLPKYCGKLAKGTVGYHLILFPASSLFCRGCWLMMWVENKRRLDRPELAFPFYTEGERENSAPVSIDLFIEMTADRH
jgi:hypothetical protein